MKHIQIAEDILPLASFKTQASQVLKKMRQSNRPVVITLNGTPAAVLITPEEFDRLSQAQRFLDSVGRGLANIQTGQMISDEQVTTELETEFGTFLGR